MQTKKLYTCITCPLSCDVELSEDNDGNIFVAGNGCKRGRDYAINEYKNPKRMLTTTVKINGAYLPLLPVISSAPIEKNLLNKALKQIYKISVNSPIKRGDVIIPDILGTGVDILASREM